MAAIPSSDDCPENQQRGTGHRRPHARGRVAEDDAFTWDVYQRFQGAHSRPEAHYLGGVAAFNRRRWSVAAKVWARVQGDDWGAAQAFAALGPLLEAEIVPPYRLPYVAPDESAHLPDPNEHPGEGLTRLARIADEPAPPGEEDLRLGGGEHVDADALPLRREDLLAGGVVVERQDEGCNPKCSGRPRRVGHRLAERDEAPRMRAAERL